MNLQKKTAANWPFPADATAVQHRIRGVRDGTELAFQLEDESWRYATADELAVYYDHHPLAQQAAPATE